MCTVCGSHCASGTRRITLILKQIVYVEVVVLLLSVIVVNIVDTDKKAKRIATNHR
jgi:hypothetical protein